MTDISALQICATSLPVDAITELESHQELRRLLCMRFATGSVEYLQFKIELNGDVVLCSGPELCLEPLQ